MVMGTDLHMNGKNILNFNDNKSIIENDKIVTKKILISMIKVRLVLKWEKI